MARRLQEQGVSCFLIIFSINYYRLLIENWNSEAYLKIRESQIMKVFDQKNSLLTKIYSLLILVLIILTLGSCYDGNFDEGCAMLLNYFLYQQLSIFEGFILHVNMHYSASKASTFEEGRISEYYQQLCTWMVHHLKICDKQLLKLVHIFEEGCISDIYTLSAPKQIWS